jgi:hypothetical protein
MESPQHKIVNGESDLALKSAPHRTVASPNRADKVGSLFGNVSELRPVRVLEIVLE